MSASPRARFALAASALLGGCFNPDFGASRYACDPALLDRDCPPGLSCIGGLCSVPGDGEASGAQDGSGGPPPSDMGPAPDLERSDGPPPQPDLAMRRPCAGGGEMLLAPDVHACPGMFAAGKAATLCGPGFHVCALPDAALLKALSLTQCRSLGGFFAAAIAAGIPLVGIMTIVTCPPPPVGSGFPALVGCGTETNARELPQNPACASLPQVEVCGGTGPWTCTSVLGDAAHAGATGGVLCCPG